MKHAVLPILCMLASLPFVEIPDCQAAVAGKDTLVIAWESTPRSFDPRYAEDLASRGLESLVHCTLITFDASGKIAGDLAEKWIWSDDKTLKVSLRSGTTFSDGTPVTSSDVKETYDSLKRKEILAASSRAKTLALIQDIQTPDAVTVTFKLVEPDAAFLSRLRVGILPTKLARTPRLEASALHVGCGPFLLSSSDTSRVVLQRNSKYSLGPRPKLETIEIRVIADETARVVKLRKGEVDLVPNALNTKVVLELSKTAPQLQVLRRTGANTTYVGFNTKDPVLKSVAVRRAISLAINRPAIIKHLFNGFALPASTLLLPSDSYYDKSLNPPPYDPKSAAKLLDEAGFQDPDGTGPQPRLTLTYKTTTNALRIQVAKSIAAMLADIGIKVTVQAMELGKLNDALTKGEMQLWGLSLDSFQDPDVYREAFAGKYVNADLDRLLRSGRGEVKEATRRQIYNKVQQLLQADMPYAFLLHEDVTAIANKSVRDFELYEDGRLTSLKVAWKE